MPIPISIRVRLIEQALYHVRRGTGLNRSGPHAVGCRNCQHLPGRQFGRELAPAGDEQLFPQRETAALTRAIFHILLGSSREQTGETAVGTLSSDIPDAPQRSMMTVPELAADALGSFLAWDMKTSTTLADLFVLPFCADPLSAVRALMRRQSNDEIDDGSAHGWQAGLRWWSGDSFFPA